MHHAAEKGCLSEPITERRIFAMALSHSELVQYNKQHTLTSWTATNDWNPISMARAEGVYFWDADGKRYIDWSSQLVNVNVGHGHPHVIKAIQEQIARLSFAHPGIATEPRARLAEMMAEIMPGDLNKVFFTLGGADAIENALKMARMSTGRQKVLGRYRAYHGATFGSMSVGGDVRRLPNEPGVPWTVHFHDPYAYRSPVYRGRTREEGDAIIADLLEETVQMEGPTSIAAIALEGLSGTSGIIQGGEVFWKRVQEICDTYGILLIVDEVMSGFGRTGEWFGVQHYPFVKPDLMTMAKGLTSGYVPLGAVGVSDKIAGFFDDHMLYAGLTYGAHPLACAAGVANIEVYKQEKLVDNAKEMGKVLRAGLVDLAEKHNCVGDIRGVGLLQMIELVKNRETREPLSGANKPLSEAMKKVSAALRGNGMSTFVRWDHIYSAPPLTVTKDQINEGLAILDQALSEADPYYEG
jgi:taurine--2-oxoglutarate transaminase